MSGGVLSLSRRRTVTAAFVGVVLAELFLQFHHLARLHHVFDAVAGNVAVQSVLSGAESFLAGAGADAAVSSSAPPQSIEHQPWSDRSIYPWGMRVCSGLGEGRMLHKSQSHATGSSIEMFLSTNNCKLSEDTVELIYAHIGPTLKGGEHLLDSIAITRRSNPCISIRLLLSKAAFDDNAEIKRICECYGVTIIFTEAFDDDPLLQQLEQVFFIAGNMGGVAKNPNFNLYTTSRMYYVRAYMAAFGVRHAIHLENDNPVYVDAAALGRAYDGCGIELGVPKREDTNFIWGFAYVQPQPLGEMLKYFIQCYKEGKDNLKERLGTQWINDMSLSADYAKKYPGKIIILPEDPNRQGKDCAAIASNVYVDGASISVWNHGTIHGDGPHQCKHGWGSYEESFDPRPYNFGWVHSDDHRCSAPVMKPKDDPAAVEMRLGNLHVHNKRIQRVTPFCQRSKSYQFREFGNITTNVVSDMLHDLSLANGAPPKSMEEDLEGNQNKNRRSSYPFITGDGFRSLCRNICDSAGCNFRLEELARGDCIFIENVGMKDKALPVLLSLFNAADPKRISPPYVLVSHNSDHSYPKTRKLANIAFDYTDVLNSTYIYHWWASNCDWRGSEDGVPRPSKLSCIPIGIENIYNKIGSDPTRYFRAMRELPLTRERTMYVSFGRGGFLKPQRGEVLSYLHSIGASQRDNAPWVTYVQGRSSWDEFAKDVRSHKFTLCPHGHGLDTHRLWETLLLGSIPIVKTSTLDSLYDGLPVVILKSWRELNENHLNKEWERLRNGAFELDRMFWPYWENRIRETMDQARSYYDEYEVEGYAMDFSAWNYSVPDVVLTPTQPEAENKALVKGNVRFSIKRNGKR